IQIVATVAVVEEVRVEHAVDLVGHERTTDVVERTLRAIAERGADGELAVFRLHRVERDEPVAPMMDLRRPENARLVPRRPLSEQLPCFAPMHEIVRAA